MNKTLNPMSINNLVESQDFDQCLGYLSLVNGIEGALLFSPEGLIMAKGENSSAELMIYAPYLLSNFLASIQQLSRVGLHFMESQVTYSDEKFYQIINLGRSNLFFLMISGTKGSYDLFKFRIERGAQAIVQLLHAQSYLRG